MRRSSRKTRLATLAFLLLVALAAAVGAWVWHSRHRDPARFVRLAEDLMARGRVDDALAQYRRALRAAGGAGEGSALMMRVAASLQRLPPQPVATAARRFATVLSLWQQAAQRDPGSHEALDTFADALYQIALRADTKSHWEKLLSLCELAVRSGREDALFWKLRGVARFRSTVWSDAPASVRQKVRFDLQRATDAMPDDADVIYCLAQILLAEAAELHEGKLGKRAGEPGTRALELVREHAAKHPDQMMAGVNHARILLTAGHLLDDRASLALGSDVLASLVPLLGSESGVEETLAVAGLLAAEDGGASGDAGRWAAGASELSLAEELLRGLAARHPTDADVLVTLAGVLRQKGDYPEAASLFERVRQSRSVPISLEAVITARLQVAATFGLASLRLHQCRVEPDPQTRQGLLAEARALRDDMVSKAGEAGLAELLAGEIDYVAGDLRSATRALDAADRHMAGRNPEAVRLCGLALAELGETGAAIERLTRYAGMPGTRGDKRHEALHQLASLHLRLAEFGRVLSLGEELRTRRPRDLSLGLLVAEAKLGRAARDPELLTRRETVAELVDELQPLVDAGVGAALHRLADLRVLTGQREAALELLAQRLSAAPDDAQAIVQALRIEGVAGDADAYRQRVLGVADRAEHKEIAGLLRRTVEGGPLSGRKVAALVRLAFERDEVRLVLGLAAHYADTGAEDEVRRVVEAVDSGSRKHPAVLRLRFDLAVREGDLARAQAIVESEAVPGVGAPEDALWEARLVLARGDYTSATSLLSDLTAQWPLVSEGWLLLGEAQRLSEELRAAEDSFGRALELRPDHPAVLERMARVHDERGEHFEALGRLQEAVGFAPSDARLVDRFLVYMAVHGSQSEALAIRGRLAELNPEDHRNRRAVANLLMERGRPELALRLLEDLMAERADDRENVMALAAFYERNGNPGAGRAVIEEYMDRRGNASVAEDWLGYGAYLVRNRQKEGVRRVLVHAVSMEDKTTMPASRLLAQWHLQQGRAGDALALFREIREATGGEGGAFGVLQALLRLGRFEEAKRELAELARTREPDGPMALLEAQIGLGLADYASARAAQERAAGVLGDQPAVHLLRAQIRWAASGGEASPETKRDLEKALASDENCVPARELIARWHARRGETVEAVRQFDTLIEQRPGHFPYLQEQVGLLLGVNDVEGLESRLEAWRARDPASPVLRDLAAKLLIRQGKWGRAADELEKMMRDVPGLSLLTDLVSVLLACGEPARALTALANGGELAETSSLLLAKKGRALAGLGRTGQAKVAFRQALRRAGADVGALQSVLVQAATVIDVRELSDGGVQGTECTTVLSVFGAREWLRAGDTQKATAELERCLSRLKTISPVRGRALLYLGACYGRDDRHADAERAFAEAAQCVPADAVVLNNLAHELSEVLGNPMKAIPLAAQACELADGGFLQAQALDTLGWAQFRAGLRHQGKATVERSVAAAELAVNRLHLGQIRLAIGDAKGGRGDIVRARDLGAARRNERVRLEAEKILGDVGGATGQGG